jgi:NADPH:quinone reductase-like Zn-dependent oxidoreductase
MGIPDVKSVSISGVSTIELTKNTICISLVEVEREFLASMNQEDMDNLHKITDTVNKIIWLTGAGMLGRLSNADLTLSSGLSRALMLEQPALSFTVIDIGPATALRESDFDTLCRCIVELQLTSPGTDDKEFILANGLLYVSRFREDSDLNEHFRRRQGLQKRVGKVALGKIQEARLSIKTPGVTDTLHFEEQLRLSTALPPDHVDIRVKAVSLNAKDVYVMGGRAETREATTSLEFSGEVVAVGSRVKQLQPGDRVVVLAPNYFSLTERVPAWAAHKLLPGEDYVETSTLPVVYATALYALEERARLHAGESVMIHSGAGALGIAAISVAQTLGAVVYATAGSPARRAYLTEELGVPGSHVFNSRDSSFVVGVKAATGGRGVDVILNSLVGDLMHASWDCGKSPYSSISCVLGMISDHRLL